MIDLTKDIPPWAYAVGAGLVVASWNKVQEASSKASGWMFVRATIDARLAGLLVQRLSQTGKRSKVGLVAYESMYSYVKPAKRNLWVLLRALPDKAQVFWVNKWPVILSLHKNKETSDSRSHENPSSKKYDVSCIRGTFLLEDVLRQELNKLSSVAQDANRVSSRFRVIKLTGEGKDIVTGNTMRGSGTREDDSVPVVSMPIDWALSDMTSTDDRHNMDQLVLCPEGLAVVKDVRSWHASSEWYHTKGRAWRRGVLLNGKPGTGKTSIARALAVELDLPVFVLDLASMHNYDLMHAWNAVASSTPCMVLLEDIDAVYNGRKSFDEDKAPSFDALLNCIDGIDGHDGILLIVTTNDLSKVDVALGGTCDVDGTQIEVTGESQRPGRIDRIARLAPTLDANGRAKIIQALLGDDPEAVDEAEKWVADDMTPAQFQERCVRLAMDRRDVFQKEVPFPSGPICP